MHVNNEIPEEWLDETTWKRFVLAHEGKMTAPVWVPFVWAFYFGPHQFRDQIDFQTAATIQREHGWE